MQAFGRREKGRGRGGHGLGNAQGKNSLRRHPFPAARAGWRRARAWCSAPPPPRARARERKKKKGFPVQAAPVQAPALAPPHRAGARVALDSPVAILVEEGERLLELGDLLVGKLCVRERRRVRERGASASLARVPALLLARPPKKASPRARPHAPARSAGARPPPAPRASARSSRPRKRASERASERVRLPHPSPRARPRTLRHCVRVRGGCFEHALWRPTPLPRLRPARARPAARAPIAPHRRSKRTRATCGTPRPAPPGVQSTPTADASAGTGNPHVTLNAVAPFFFLCVCAHSTYVCSSRLILILILILI